MVLFVTCLLKFQGVDADDDRRWAEIELKLLHCASIDCNCMPSRVVKEC